MSRVEFGLLQVSSSAQLRGGLLLSCLLLACGQAPAVPPDSSVGLDGGGDANDVQIDAWAPAPPNIPWLDAGLPSIAPPMLTPCPEGWHEIVEEDPAGGQAIVTCDPYGDEPGGGEPATCPDGSAHFVGDLGCTSVGAPCPSEDFPDRLPADATLLYVLSTAPAGGDGSRALPFSTIADAMTLATEGTIIVVGKGVYAEAVRMRAGVTLWGACAAETRLMPPGPVSLGAVAVISPDTQLKNLSIGPAGVMGLVVRGPGASVSIDGLIIEGARTAGLFVADGASVRGRELSISDTEADPAGAAGLGIAAQTSSRVDLTRVLIAHSFTVGISARDEGTSLTLSDLLIRDTESQQSDGTLGFGLNAEAGATVTVARALVLRNHESGVIARDPGTSLTFSDLIVRETGGTRSDGRGGMGFAVWSGATATLTRALLSRNSLGAIHAWGDDTSLTLSDVIVRDTEAAVSDARGGLGLVVDPGARVEVDRALLARNRSCGIRAEGAGTSLRLSNVVVRDTQAQESDGLLGRGLGVSDGASLEVSHAHLSGNREIGVFVHGDGTSLTLSDVVVEDTREQERNRTAGRGLNVQDGATVDVIRARLSRNRSLGVFAANEGTRVTLSDVVVEDTQHGEVDGAGGRGINVQFGAAVTLTRARFSRNRDVGVFAVGTATTVQLSDVVVERTDEQACSDTTCADRPFGMGLAALLGAHLTSTRFDVRDSVLCGVMVAEDGQVDLSVGRVSGSQIGVCLQVAGYVSSRLTDRVDYFDNETNLDATSLPIPATPAEATW